MKKMKYKYKSPYGDGLFDSRDETLDALSQIADSQSPTHRYVSLCGVKGVYDSRTRVLKICGINGHSKEYADVYSHYAAKQVFDEESKKALFF
jgi:hypothetical protein